MEELEPIDEQLVRISRTQSEGSTICFSNQDYDVMFGKDLTSFSLVNHKEKYGIIYDINFGWSFPQKLIHKNIVETIKNISYEIDIEIREKILILLNEYPYYEDNYCTLDVGREELELELIDNGFLRYFWCFRNEKYHNSYIPLIRATHFEYEYEKIKVRLSNRKNIKYKYKLVKNEKQDYNGGADIIYHYKISKKNMLRFGVGLWLIFGMDNHCIYIDAEENMMSTILKSLIGK